MAACASLEIPDRALTRFELMSAPSDTERRFIVDAKDDGERLDVYLAHRLEGASRSRVQALIREGRVTVDGKTAKASLTVARDQTVAATVPAPAPIDPIAEDLPLSILHDDEDIVVVEKPAGMVVHPAAGHSSGTLVHALLHHVRGLSGIGGRSRPGIVHRLDRGTSGVMVVAKHDRAHQALSRQFHDRTVHKVYVALVWGRPDAGRTFDQPIGRDPRDRQKISSRARHGRSAFTRIDEVEPLAGVSLLHLTIGSGRTHQIRVHLSEAGFPIVGDALYGGARRRSPGTPPNAVKLGRPFLHASRLSFEHPADGRTVTFESPLPEDLQSIVEVLRHRATPSNGE
jgi:23S rRNA pseudouridine1911/1915/1917 synthase